jgi:hypothetical protein
MAVNDAATERRIPAENNERRSDLHKIAQKTAAK